MIVWFAATLLVGCSDPVTPKAGPAWVEIPPSLKRVVLGKPRPLRPFELQDHEGKPFSNARFKGRWSLIFFGYTHCPDICPTSMNLMAELFEVLKERGEVKPYQGLFVSVDPDRDELKLLKDYVGYFNPTFIGIKGDVKKTASLAADMGAVYYREPGGTPKDYLIAHSAKMHVVDPDGQMIALLPTETTGEELADYLIQIKKLQKRESPS
uniref:Putative electron transport protein SCO1/SenC n=1 Tax=Magnetococcus massalia (strain MO-1) TaxID=451514 RepID=A0A1S7LD55_MAGMO|nr:Putative electron transport protein SCO1/SenC [Candidatus Magnetococcus massalia]